MTSPGVVLSQPPISTAPSIGWLRSSSSHLHGEEVAVEHGRRFDERLGERHRRQLDREAAGLPDAALHVFGARAQMAVAGVDVAPGVEDADDRLAGPIVAVIAELLAAASDGRRSADRRARTSGSCAVPRAIFSLPGSFINSLRALRAFSAPSPRKRGPRLNSRLRGNERVKPACSVAWRAYVESCVGSIIGAQP